MLNHPTHDQLHQLRLFGMARAPAEVGLHLHAAALVDDLSPHHRAGLALAVSSGSQAALGCLSRTRLQSYCPATQD